MSQKIVLGDAVFHKPSGEEWIVLGVRGERDELYPAGWPPCCAKLSDCTFIEHTNFLSGDDWRESRAKAWPGIVFDDEREAAAL